MSDAQVDSLKANDESFYNTIYGGKYGNAPDEGYKYRGRGFNGITFKGIYQKMQKLLDGIGKLRRLSIIDVVEIEHLLDLDEREPDPLAPQDQRQSHAITWRVDARLALADRLDELLVFVKAYGPWRNAKLFSQLADAEGLHDSPPE